MCMRIAVYAYVCVQYICMCIYKCVCVCLCVCMCSGCVGGWYASWCLGGRGVDSNSL